MAFVTGVAVLCGLLAFPVPLRGQTDTLTAGVHLLDEVQVSAPRLSREMRSAAPFQSLSHDRLDRLGAADLPSALRHLTGLTLKDYGGEGGMKTVSLRSLGAQHTGVMLDGVPLASQQGGQVDLSRYSLDFLEDLSVVSASAGSLLDVARTAASASTLSLRSGMKDLSGRPWGMDVRLRSGSWGLLSSSVRLDHRLGRRAEVMWIADWMRSDNDYRFYLRNGSASTWLRRRDSYVRSAHLEGNVVLHLGGGTLSGKLYGYDSWRHLPGPVILYSEGSNQRQRDRNLFFQSVYQAAILPAWSLKAALKGDFSYQMYSDRDASYPGGYLRNTYRQGELYASAVLLFQPSSLLGVSNALDFTYDALNASTGVRPFRRTLLDALTLRLDLDRLQATGQVLGTFVRDGERRMGGEGERGTARLSPSLMLSFRPLASSSWMIRASLKDVFRMPSFSELYYGRFQSQDLRPERAFQMNLGSTLQLLGRGVVESWSLRADAYLNRVSDKIVAMPYNMFFWTVVNLGTVRIVGMEAGQDLELRPWPGQALTLSASYTFQDATDRTDAMSPYYGDQIPYTPRHAFSSALAWSLRDRLGVSLSLLGVSCRYSDVHSTPDTRIPGYWDLGLGAWGKFHVRDLMLTVRCDVQNVLDAQYEVVRCYPMPGCGLKLTLALEF